MAQLCFGVVKCERSFVALSASLSSSTGLLPPTPPSSSHMCESSVGSEIGRGGLVLAVGGRERGRDLHFQPMASSIARLNCRKLMSAGTLMRRQMAGFDPSSVILNCIVPSSARRTVSAGLAFPPFFGWHRDFILVGWWVLGWLGGIG